MKNLLHLSPHFPHLPAQVESLTPQLVGSGRIRMTYPESRVADEHFENLRWGGRMYTCTLRAVQITGFFTLAYYI